MEQVEAVCRKALGAADRHAAIRPLRPQVDTPVPGLRSGGLVAMQELEHGVPKRSATGPAPWGVGQALQGQQGPALIHGLRFTTEELPGPAMLLLAGNRKTAVAILRNRPEEIESTSAGVDGVSPVSYTLALADREHLDCVVVVAGSTRPLYPATLGAGTGRRGHSETFVEADLDPLSEDDAGYLWILLPHPPVPRAGPWGRSFSEARITPRIWGAGFVNGSTTRSYRRCPALSFR